MVAGLGGGIDFEWLHAGEWFVQHGNYHIGLELYDIGGIGTIYALHR